MTDNKASNCAIKSVQREDDDWAQPFLEQKWGKEKEEEGLIRAGTQLRDRRTEEATYFFPMCVWGNQGGR